MPDATILTIQTDGQRLGILPGMGGSAAFWEVLRDDAWQPIWRPYEATSDGRRIVGNFPLVPWSNRITAGGITVDGTFHPMEVNRGDVAYPIHGNGWMQAWHVQHHTERRLELVLESHRYHDYPYDYEATQLFEVDEDGMTMRLEVTHLGDVPMPYGLAWHPFYLRGADLDGPRVQFAASGYWQETGSLPTEHVNGLPPAWDFNTLRPLGHGRIDNNFSGWDGRMRMERDDIDLTIDWTTVEPAGLDLAIFFRPERQPFFCFEPITHITDAFHRPGMPGLRMLSHGQGMALEVRQRLGRVSRA
ncbi:MAG: aldose 1-epimerase [Rhodocyclaceae bacterium]